MMSVPLSSNQSYLYSHSLIFKHPLKNFYIWEEENLALFDELIISWNAFRPIKGQYMLHVSVKVQEWSFWLPYAQWGKDEQESFHYEHPNGEIRVYQDIVEIQSNKKATGFRIRIEAQQGALLEQFLTLYGCATDLSNFQLLASKKVYYPICLNVPGLSQFALSHPRHRSLCSPTSTIAVIRYCLNNNDLEISHFAQLAWDKRFDIFGHWVFNVAQAFVHLGRSWKCWVSRLNSFDELFSYLEQQTPVIVSIKGSLPNALFPYSSGHLIVVRGYDPVKQQVLCMDPAFLSDENTYVAYPLEDFLQAWQGRNLLAYLFRKIKIY